MINQEPNTQKQENNQKICPFFGMINDRVTYSNYPSNWNTCFRSHPNSSPNFEHQTIFCLTKSYESCPVYQNPDGQKMPKKIKLKGDKSFWVENRNFLIFGLIGLSLLLMVIFVPRMGKTPTTDAQGESSSVLEVSSTPENELAFFVETAEKTSTINPIKTPTQTPTQIRLFEVETEAFPTHVQKLDQPIGQDYKYLIHRIAEGESVQQYAEMYNTTKEAIYDSNYLLPVPIWINWLIIIPINMSDVSDLPAFEAYLVESDMIQLNEVADLLSVTSSDLAKYNNLSEDTKLRYGDWLIIPRERQQLQ